MKFSVSSSELLKQVQLASGAIGSNPVLPILEDFLFVIENKKLTITDLKNKNLPLNSCKAMRKKFDESFPLNLLEIQKRFGF